MTVILTEGKLQITVHNAIRAYKFDGPAHGLSHCMKGVDYIVELADHYQYIEIKDPQDPQSPPSVAASYSRRFTSAQIDNDFVHKYRDTFLYEWASGRADKPIDYLMLIAIDTLTAAHLRNRQREMQRKLPLTGPASHQWTRPIVRSCSVFNIAAWNRHLPNCPVQRLP